MMTKKEKSWGFYKKSEFIREGEKTPYLIRYNLFECPWFSIKIHRILQTDNDCPHDHPWAFWSWIIKGGYIEHQVLRDGEGRVLVPANHYPAETCTYYGRWSFLRRPANWIHRLELDAIWVPYLGGYARRKVEVPATTLVVTFKKSREWGFWTKKGWIPWNKYKGVNKCD